ncbi:EpsG family protein [Vibrio splendidus]
MTAVLLIISMTVLSLKVELKSDVAVNLEWISQIILGTFNLEYIKGEYFYYYLINGLSFFVSEPEMLMFLIVLFMNSLLMLISCKLSYRYSNATFIFISLFSTILVFPFLLRQSLSILIVLLLTLSVFRSRIYILVLFSSVFFHLSSFILFLSYIFFKYIKINPVFIFIASVSGLLFLKLEYVVGFLEFLNLDIISTKLLYYSNMAENLDVVYDYYAIYNSFTILALVMLNPYSIANRSEPSSFILWLFFVSSALLLFTVNIPIMASRVGFLVVYLTPIFYILFYKVKGKGGFIELVVFYTAFLCSFLIVVKRLFDYVYNEAWVKFDVSSTGSLLFDFIL